MSANDICIGLTEEMSYGGLGIEYLKNQNITLMFG